jgi:hypothetical protein
MKTVFVIVYAHNENSIANKLFFSSREEAWSWKKEQIANKECGNPIEAYEVICLYLLRLFK